MNRNRIFRMVATAMLIALVALLGFTPLGLIPLGFVYLTILHIPVIIGTIVLGLGPGMVLGLSFGIVSTIKMFTAPSGLVAPLMGANLFYSIVMCIIPRLLVPLFTWLVYKVIAGKRQKRVIAVPFAAIAGSVTNTVFYLGLMYIFYRLTGLDVVKLAEGLGVAGLGFLGIIGAIAGGGGGLEAVAAAIISTPIAAAIWKKSK